MKKAIGMFAALTIALAMSGVAFAHWSEVLTISGTVSTGTLDVAWSEVCSFDTDDQFDPWGEPLAPEGKDVSSITCTIDREDPNLLHVTVTNAYPSIHYFNVVDIHNEGTIPVHVYDVVISNPNPDKVEVEITYWSYDPETPEEPPVQLYPPVQLHPCEEIYALIHVHLTQAAEESTTYDFSATIVADQWNA